MRGEDSAPKEKLNWHCMKVLSMHTHTKTFCRRSCCRLRKSGFRTKRKRGNCNKTRRLVTQQSPLSVGWSSMGKVGPRKVMTCNPIENLWAILDERLESKKFKTENGMKKAIRQVWEEVDLSLLHNLINSVPDRLRRIRKAKGGPIKAVK